MIKNILKKFIVLLSLCFILFGFRFTFAEEGNIVLQNNCSVEDINKNVYNFPLPDSPSEYLAICALAEARTQGIIESFELVEFSGMGLFVDSINGIKDPNTSYWALYYNDTYELDHGLTTLPLVVGDSISLVYVDFDTKPLGPRIDIHIVAPIPTPEDPIETTCSNESTNPPVCDNNMNSNTNSGGSTVGGYIPPIVVNVKSFSIPQAVSFLSIQQKPDGSFGNPLYTDWVAIGLAKVSGLADSLKSKLSNYLKNNIFNSSIATDNERHAMALMSLGINPYDGTSVNYIKKITDSFDGTQIGDKSLFNDDIFGIIVLQNAGYNDDDEIIEKTISFIISKQSPDGSWGSVDMTSAGIMALRNFDSISGVSSAISKAENYLLGVQNTSGGFDNPSSTSWATQALSQDDSLNVQTDKAIEYITTKQQDDGGIEGSGVDNRVWVTSYAIPAILRLSWSNILQSFDKVEDTKNLSSQDKPDILPIPEIPTIVPIAPDINTEIIPTTQIIKEIKPQIKKITVKKVQKIKPIYQEVSNGNSLQASVASFDENDNNNKSVSIISKILNKLEAPFVWLWIHLGF